MAPDTSSTAHRDALLLRFVPGLLAAVRRTDTDHPLFHGCIDWHSAVHGHWALLRIANVTGAAAEAAEEVVSSLGGEALETERKDLASRPFFETPYGRAWFLRLTLEFEARSGPGSPSPLRPMADELASTLLDYHATRPASPETREYANDPWSLAQLHAYGLATGNERWVGEVRRTVERSFLDAAPPVDFSEDARRPEFFSRFGNWAYLVAKTTDPKILGVFLEAHPVDEADLAPIEAPLGPAHHLGMNWSRAWAFRALSRTLEGEAGRRPFEAAFRAHVETGMKHHGEHEDRYGAYGHWVPQFAVYALTEGT
ncbi:MAG: DUF2891 family protein [Planctomycetota bacterium]|jgi:hypothetical protein